MTDLKSIEVVTLPETPPPIDFTRTAEEQANFEKWDKVTADQLYQRLRRLDFIVDQWGILDHYADITLPNGWSLQTTSKQSNTVGTIYLFGKDEKRKATLNRNLKMYIANHGIRLSQADTFIETLYYAKFLVLPHLSVVLNDDKLYQAFRKYSRDQKMSQYVEWVHKHNLQHNEFAVKLTPMERAGIGELLSRMALTDYRLRDWRAQCRLEREAKALAKNA